MKLLDTIHGSRLYGLATPFSDTDRYIVTDNPDRTRSQHVQQGDLDLHIHPVEHFKRMVDKGAPTALEALYSPVATIQPGWEPFFENMHPNRSQMRDTYQRAIVAWLARRNSHGRLHALRLITQLDAYRAKGRFSPVLTPDQVSEFRELAGAEDGRIARNYQRELKRLMGRNL